MKPHDHLSREDLIRLLEAHERSGQKFSLAFKACPDPILITRRHDGKIIEANEAFDRIYGVPAAQVLGRTTIELGIWSDAAARNRMLEVLKAEGCLRDFECEIDVRSGERRAGLVSAESIQIDGEACLVVVFRDVTLQHKAELALRESEERFHSLAAAAFEGISITEAGRVVEVNDQMAQMLGCTREELMGRSVIDFVAEESRSFVGEMICAGKEGPYEHLAARKDGSTFQVEVQARNFFSGQRQLRVTSIRDITARKAAEESLRSSEERLRATVENTPHVAVQWYDAGGRIVYWNPASETLFGWTAGEAMGKTLDQLIFSPETAAMFLRRLGEVQRTGRSIEPMEYPFHRRNGTEGICLSTTFRIPAGNGQHCVVCMDVEVTEQKRAVEALRVSEERFELAVRGSHDGIWDWDVRTDKVYHSPRFLELLGYGPDELPDFRESFDSHLHPEDRSRTWKAIHTHLRTRAPYDVEFRILTRAGEYRWFRSRGQAVWDADGKALRMAGSISDIHDQKIVREFLRRAQEATLAAQKEFTRQLIFAQEQERKRFASELHDSIGQNLSVIKNRVHLALKHSDAPAVAAEHIEAIGKSAADAIEEVRNLAHNLRPLHIEEFGVTESLEDLVEQVAQSMTIRVEQRLENVDDVFRGDQATILYRIVQEILNNLVKHSQARRAAVILERDLHCVRIWVKDDGCGFDMGGSASGKTRKGIGLISIGERVRMLRGAMRIQSAPGQGTEIRIELPIAETARPVGSDVGEVHFVEP